MARPQRNNVDYFPFYCEDGNKMFYLEETYGNDGFATFVKLLRELARTDYHYLNLSKPSTMMYLSAKCKVSKEILERIINDLVELGKFDSVLWNENKIVWCQDFIDSIQDAYIKRKHKCITLDGLYTLLVSLGIRKQGLLPLKGGINTQRKEEKSKEDKNIEKSGLNFDLDFTDDKPTEMDIYLEQRDEVFANLDESFKEALRVNIGIERPYVWCNRQSPQGYFDLVDCIIRIREDVDWRSTFQRNNNVSKEKLLSGLYEFVKKIISSQEYLGFDGYNSADGQNNFIKYFSNWFVKQGK